MELRDLTETERKLVVFAAYGRTMLHAHALEFRLATILSVRIMFVDAPEQERENRIKRIRESTFGVLIKDFVIECAPNEDIQEELDNMLFFRNELTHRISKTILLAAQKPEWEVRVATELEEMSQMFIETEELLEKFVEELRAKIGWKEEIMQEFAARMYPGISA